MPNIAIAEGLSSQAICPAAGVDAPLFLEFDAHDPEKQTLLKSLKRFAGSLTIDKVQLTV